MCPRVSLQIYARCSVYLCDSQEIWSTDIYQKVDTAYSTKWNLTWKFSTHCWKRGKLVESAPILSFAKKKMYTHHISEFYPKTLIFVKTQHIPTNKRSNENNFLRNLSWKITWTLKGYLKNLFFTSENYEKLKFLQIKLLDLKKKLQENVIKPSKYCTGDVGQKKTYKL